MENKTNWTEYYDRVPGYTQRTRKISSRKIIALLKEYQNKSDLKICELGGGNSFIAEDLFRSFKIKQYHIVDSNQAGIRLLEKVKLDYPLTSENSDVLLPYIGSDKYDVVFSVGLIEHFDKEGTGKAIKAHFDRAKSQGLVLITYPTPTILYRIIRGLAELLGLWKFPDERPLKLKEVASHISQYGQILTTKINWSIGLTQEYIIVRKN